MMMTEADGDLRQVEGGGSTRWEGVLCPPGGDNNPDRGSFPLNLPSTKNSLPKSAQIKQSKEDTRKPNLTRFGLNAYVLGAIRERFNCFGRRLQLLAASLNARELQQIPAIRFKP